MVKFRWEKPYSEAREDAEDGEGYTIRFKDGSINYIGGWQCQSCGGYHSGRCDRREYERRFQGGEA